MSKKPKKTGPEKRGRGRPATGHAPVLSIRLSVEDRAGIDSVLGSDETRAEFIRGAIEREIARRERAK